MTVRDFAPFLMWGFMIGGALAGAKDTPFVVAIILAAILIHDGLRPDRNPKGENGEAG